MDILRKFLFLVGDHFWINAFLLGTSVFLAAWRKWIFFLVSLVIIFFVVYPARFLIFGILLNLDFLALGTLIMCLFLHESWGKKILLRTSVCTLFIVLVSPLGRILLYQLEHRVVCETDIPEDAAGLILLGGYFHLGEGETGGRPIYNVAGGRLFEFGALAHRYPHLPIILTGTAFEIEMTLKILKEIGIDASRIRLDNQAKNTVGNSRNSWNLLQEDEKERPWVLVTSAFHMPRSLGLFTTQGWKIIPYSVDYHTATTSFSKRWMMGFDHLNALCFRTSAKEWAGMLNHYIDGTSNVFYPKS